MQPSEARDEPEPATYRHEEQADSREPDDSNVVTERCFLVGMERKGRKQDHVGYTVHESLEELGRLARTAGLEV